MVVWKACVGAVAALIIGQIVLVYASRDTLDIYSKALLEHTSSVHSNAMSVLEMSAHIQSPPCSENDLNELRYILFKTAYLVDLGRVIDGELLCSAGWGRLDPARPFPPATRHQANGTRLWSNARNPVDSRVSTNIIARGNAAVFVSPRAFQVFDHADDNISAIVTTADGKYVPRSFGDTERLLHWTKEQETRFQFGPVLTTRTCASDLDICVTASLDKVNIFQQSGAVWIWVLLIGAAVSAGAGTFSIFLQRRATSPHRRLKKAISSDGLYMVYQPLVRLGDKAIIGAEALVRMKSQDGVILPPEEFISIAEKTGDISKITRIVINRSLTEMRTRLSGADNFYLSINLSASDVLDASLIDFLNTQTSERSIPRNRILLEITERSGSNHDALVKGVEEFKRNGYQFLLDDFGTGHSNLAYLATIPIKGIKLDKMFTQSVGEDDITSDIVEKICSIASNLNVMFVVEGVETHEHAQRVSNIYPDAIGQGWFFGRPVPIDEFEKYSKMPPEEEDRKGAE